jgi:ABC-type dipeptide/oligopeptide/nickel transport system permease subunit
MPSDPSPSSGLLAESAAAAGAAATVNVAKVAPAASKLRRVAVRLRSKKGMTGLVIVLVALITTLFGDFLMPHDPTAQIVQNRFLPPVFDGGTWQHVLGSDNLGRDILSRTIAGARVSVGVSLVVVACALVVGTFLGLIAGYFGGFIDSLIMRITDFELSLPFILIALIFLAVLGPGALTAILALAATLWINYARLVRAEVMKLRTLEYVTAARSIGVGPFTIIRRHLMPAILPGVIVMATLDLSWAMIFEASLSFLGLGVQPPQTSWGVMISEGRGFLTQNMWIVLAPSLAIILTAMGINLLGDFLQDALDSESGSNPESAQR